MGYKRVIAIFPGDSMLVSEYIDYAVKGELKPLSVSDIGGESPNATQKNNRETIVSYLNLANSEIHKKFALLQREFLLESVEDGKYFDLPTDFIYAVSASYPEGVEISVNNERILVDPQTGLNYCVSVMFPAPFKAIVKGEWPSRLIGRTFDTGTISLVYVAKPPLVLGESEFLDVSDAFTEAILYYVAYKAYASVQGDIQATNNTYYLRFIESCKNIRIEGLVNSDNLNSNMKLVQNGFV